MALAGGQSLIPMMRFRLLRPTVVVDIGRIHGLDSIESSGDGIEIGALATTNRVAQSATVRSLSPLWAETASVIADPLVRNLGTVGGNLAHADPLNDLPAALVAARGRVFVEGVDGRRVIGSDDLFTGPFETSLHRGELITGVRLPGGTGGAYEKMKRAAADYGVAGVAVQMTMNGARPDHRRRNRGDGGRAGRRTGGGSRGPSGGLGRRSFDDRPRRLGHRRLSRDARG